MYDNSNVTVRQAAEMVATILGVTPDSITNFAIVGLHDSANCLIMASDPHPHHVADLLSIGVLHMSGECSEECSDIPVEVLDPLAMQ